MSDLGHEYVSHNCVRHHGCDCLWTRMAALEAQRDEALKYLSAALTGHIGPGIPAGPQTFRRGEMADLEAALATLSGDWRVVGE